MNTKTALVVDDSKSARFALRRYLEGHQYRVDALETAEEAMRFLETNRPEVIFLDHVMPGIDGFQALQILKGTPATAAIPVVICSSNEGPEFNSHARALGASGVLQKPPNPEQLIRLLDSLITGADPSADNGAASAYSATRLSTEMVPMPDVPRPPMAPARDHALSPVAASNLNLRDDSGTREQLEGRLKKLSQGLFVQFAEIKATVAHLQNQQSQLAEAPGARSELRAGLDETNQALRLVTSRLEGLEREVFAQLTTMRTHLDNTLRLNTERVSEIVQFARQAAAEEAQLVAERTVMSAALRISDQLSDAILGAAGKR